MHRKTIENIKTMTRLLTKNIILTVLALITVLGFAASTSLSPAQALSGAGPSRSGLSVLRANTIENVAASAIPPCSSTDYSSNCSDSAISCTSSNCNLIQEYVVPTINLLGASFGLIAVISLIFGAINYITSEGDPQKVSKAKLRIRNTIFAIVSFMFLYAFLNFLVPGGIIK